VNKRDTIRSFRKIIQENMKKTKIIATIWPATNNKQSIIDLYTAWVNVIRFNFSHANYNDVEKTVHVIKDLNKKGITNLSLLLDTKWPEIRTGDLDKKIEYIEWDIFNMYTDPNIELWNNGLFCDYQFLLEWVNIWSQIVIDSWLFLVEVIEKQKKHVVVKALNSATIWSRRHVNLPWVSLNFPGITEKDISDIQFAIKHDFAFIAASFIRSASNVQEIKDLFKRADCNTLKIISKIENQEWVENLDEIIDISDWVMVARGDLWIEVPIQKLAIYQKEIVEKCNKKWKFVITATHLLETMIDNPVPTRAESSDVFNSVLQKADCLMLSGETAIWKFPIKCVEMMTSIIEEAESIVDYRFEDFSNDNLSLRDIEKKLLIRSALFIGKELWAQSLIILTKTWLLARLTGAFRPSIPVHSFTPFETSVRNTNLLFWINTSKLEKWDREDFSHTLDEAIDELKEKWIIKNGDKVVAINDIQKKWTEIPIMEIINIK